jgi:uncharacterized protein YndB with AHSA1/START domain
MNAVITNSIEIERSPESVFDYLSDMANEPSWNPDCVSVEQLTEGPVDVGTRFRAKWKQSPFVEAECTEHERPRHWRYMNGGPISVDLAITLEPSGADGTRMTAHGVWTPHGWFRLIFPIFARVMRRAEAQTVANAKRALEDRRDRSV